MQFIKACPRDLLLLNRVVKESKGYWGYTEEFCQAFIDKWGIKPDYFNTAIVEVLNNGTDIIGVVGMSHTEEYPMLDYFFLRPDYIGQGLGKKMWERVIEIALQQNWMTFRFVSDPNSEAIYKHWGAIKIAEEESFPGRFVPVMEYVMKKNSDKKRGE